MQLLVNGWILVLVYAAGWLLVVSQPRAHWTIARGTALAGLVGVVASVAAAVAAALLTGFSPDRLGLVAALLVALLGWVIINYSSRYLAGDRQQGRFVRAMLFTLLSVSLLLLSQDLLTIALAWTGTSIGLHYLLTHYPNRKAAQIVAHKKFLVSRLAEVCLIVALLLIYQSTGTLWLDELSAYLAGRESLPSTLHWAAALIALAAILKTAQLPLHGWLIQVMEAPTPVSALLHAGVVNMGGFVLIRLAELISLAPAAQLMLVIAGSTTAVLASLVMMTRISIKVRLAWSTCAQMGFMLLEIGLGLYELALLHLVAHSLYKAHAFLGAGGSAETARSRAFFAHRGSAQAPYWYGITAVLSGLLVVAAILPWRAILPELELPLITLVIVALGLAPLLWLEEGRTPWSILRGAGLVLALTQFYLIWHLVFATVAPAASATTAAVTIWVLLSFIILYSIQFWLRCHPQGLLARTLYPWAYSGFYLDESFTRLTFRIWPARLSPAQAQTQVNRCPTPQGEPS
ncbi:MAG: NADH-quinone oxidoreductase subunit L [Gammaproteobacteria bacterium]|nr:NADH-quinone oxidoreductase subunit L [Gammaproteobacteria bacterium]